MISYSLWIRPQRGVKGGHAEYCLHSRTLCLNCRRPQQVCVCAEIRPIPSQTRVVFLQHPREARMPISTCRLAHLSLPNSKMFVALHPEGQPHLEAIVQAPGTVLLFPGPEAIDITELRGPPQNLIVVDGTWINARKLVERSPLLSALPRVGFRPVQPSNYRIRKEPAEYCLSTIEAVVHVLESLEQAPGRFMPMLRSFERMVDLQLQYMVQQPQSRHQVHRRPPIVQQLQAVYGQLVLVFAEGNVWPDDKKPLAATEIMHWVAIHPASGRRFEAILRPQHPLAPYTPRYLGISEAHLLEGMSWAEAFSAWQAFLPADPLLATWGSFSVDLLRSAGLSIEKHLDMKRILCNIRQAPLGGVAQVASALGWQPQPDWGRARQKTEALCAALGALLAEAATV